MKIVSLRKAIFFFSATLISTNALAQTSELSNSLEEWFLKHLSGENTDKFSTDKTIKLSDISSTQKIVWDAWKKANDAFEEEKLTPVRSINLADSGEWHIPAPLESDAVMKYYWGSKGEKPEKGYPLFLYLHGSGDPDREWSNGLYFAKTFADSSSVYFVPRIPRTGEYYRWWQKGKQYAWEKLLRQTLANDEIDPDRIYFFGISEGGYGSQRLASFYADYLAAAGPMAGGEPLANAPAENCCDEKNITFNINARNTDISYMKLEDITALFCNLIDNAIEAAEGMEHAHINLHIQSSENNTHTVITVINSCCHAPIMKNNHYRTSKSNPNMHGIGTYSLQRVIDKYNGDSETYYLENEKEFHAVILLRHKEV